MNALELLTTRSSMPRVVAPGPTDEQLDLMITAAARAPDHMALQPYQITIFQGEQLAELGTIFAKAAAAKGEPEAQVERAKELPLRAPMVIVVAMTYQEHDKVPRDEQFASAACAALLLQQAAFAQGLGAVWRTGWFAEDEGVKQALGLTNKDAIVGFMYVGTPVVNTPIKPHKDMTEKVRYWGQASPL